VAEQMHRCGQRPPPDASEFAAVELTTLPCHAIASPRIAQAPVAFEFTPRKLVETASRQIFIGQTRWLRACDGLIDAEAWRVRLKEYFPVARFGASFYVTTRDRFTFETRASLIDEIRH
jgi:flavin reductase (DIM6/NTAB) family NADH-FMN oxidoreductase RutF